MAVVASVAALNVALTVGLGWWHGIASYSLNRDCKSLDYARARRA
jgi:hypothetical protein